MSVGTDVTFCYGAFFQYRKTRVGNRVLIGYFNTTGEVDIAITYSSVEISTCYRAWSNAVFTTLVA